MSNRTDICDPRLMVNTLEFHIEHHKREAFDYLFFFSERQPQLYEQLRWNTKSKHTWYLTWNNKYNMYSSFVAAKGSLKL